MRSKLLAALLVSEALHLLLFGLLADVIIDPPREIAIAGSMDWIHDDPPERNLINDDISIDPDFPLHYDLPWIEDIVVPGPIQPEEAFQPLNSGRPRTR